MPRRTMWPSVRIHHFPAAPKQTGQVPGHKKSRSLCDPLNRIINSSILLTTFQQLFAPMFRISRGETYPRRAAALGMFSTNGHPFLFSPALSHATFAWTQGRVEEVKSFCQRLLHPTWWRAAAPRCRNMAVPGLTPRDGVTDTVHHMTRAFRWCFNPNSRVHL